MRRERCTQRLAYAGVLVPLALLVGLELAWLGRLEQASRIEHQAALRNSLDTVAAALEHFFRSTAEGNLNIPPSRPGLLEIGPIEAFWKKRPLEGVRRLYLVDYTRTPSGNFHAFDPAERSLAPAKASDESLAVVVACLPFQDRVRRGALAEGLSLQVSEQDPENRVVLGVLTDEASRIQGVLALVPDEGFLREVLLPRTIERTALLPAGSGLVVRDQADRVIFGGGDPDSTHQRLRLHIPFVFKDWTLELSSSGSAQARFARSSFLLNTALAILLAGVLLGGLAFALRAAHKAVKLSEMKSAFVSNVSHELCTPLASIRLYAEHLRAGRITAPDKVRAYGETIEAEGQRLMRLIDNVLDFSRIESGRKIYRTEATDLTDLVEEVVRSFEARLATEGFELTLHLPSEPLPSVPVDRMALGQAISNLLDNAAKYSQERRCIRVSVYESAGSAAIAVQDQGVGIAAEEQSRIFERFYRVGSSLVHDIKGAGLGLAIVEHVVRAHGGSVHVESAPGCGSTFTIRLPVASG